MRSSNQHQTIKFHNVWLSKCLRSNLTLSRYQSQNWGKQFCDTSSWDCCLKSGIKFFAKRQMHKQGAKGPWKSKPFQLATNHPTSPSCERSIQPIQSIHPTQIGPRHPSWIPAFNPVPCAFSCISGLCIKTSTAQSKFTVPNLWWPLAAGIFDDGTWGLGKTTSWKTWCKILMIFYMSKKTGLNVSGHISIHEVFRIFWC